MATNNIQVVLELGHTALCRQEGHLTHDWVVFLRGPKENPSAIQTIIRKVVFTLHPSFQNPIRVVDKPPYEIRESGYAGFILPIDIYFKGRSDDMPYRIRFDYDLTIPPNESINSLQTEKITFRNPSVDFRRKLLEGGGCGVLETDLDAVMPGKRLVQMFKNPAAGHGMHAGKLEGIPSFEEFARLFKMTLSSTQKNQAKTADGKRIRKASSGSSASSTAGEKAKRLLAPAEEKAKREKNVETTAAAVRSPVPNAPVAEKKNEGEKKAAALESVGKTVKISKGENHRPPGINTSAASATRTAKSVLLQPDTNTSNHSHTAQVPAPSSNSYSRPDNNVNIPAESDVSPSPHNVAASSADSVANPASASLLGIMTPPSRKTTPRGSSQPLTPHTPYLSDEMNDEIRQQTSVPRMLSPLSPPEDYPNDGSSVDEDLALTPGPRRDSTGFSPAQGLPKDGSSLHNPDSYLLDLTNDGFISGISDPSDTSPEPSPQHRPPVKSKQKNSSKTTPATVSLSAVESDLRDVQINHKPISPVDGRDDVALDPVRVNDIKPRALSPAEELERYKLQVVLSQLTDRTMIQSIVDVLVPLGAFNVDEKEGVLTFNTSMLEKPTVEIIKKLARFEEYTFETEE
ncbi:protein AF-9-like isoform X2 [Paramacrobiotus metropolitanus]|uniref:protein AF-9-like isoform X2 n=1 Tax=Paramacrobiotus metropolitanus TaxID=2943436 RepID=UPI002445E287|nr:protein AF-9-like isoform X2 [Paramacrobiotus metropolitanus]